MFGKKEQPPIKTLIAAGTRIEGNMRFDEGMRVDGEVLGDVRAAAGEHSMLVVSEAAVVEGAIEADHVIINGTVRGPVQARELLELQPKARIEGDINYVALEIHTGAIISGRLQPLGTEQLSDADGEKPTLKLAAKNA